MPGAAPAPRVAASHAAVWLGKTESRDSGTPNARSMRLTSLTGSVAEGSTSHGHWAGGPGRRTPGAANTTRRARNTGSLMRPGPPDRSGPSATSASRWATSALISAVADTPAVTSIDPDDRAVNASARGAVKNSTSALVATSRSRSAAPLAERTADSASAPSETICAAMVSRRDPPAVSSMPLPVRVSSGSSR